MDALSEAAAAAGPVVAMVGGGPPQKGPTEPPSWTEALEADAATATSRAVPAHPCNPSAAAAAVLGAAATVLDAPAGHPASPTATRGRPRSGSVSTPAALALLYLESGLGGGGGGLSGPTGVPPVAAVPAEAAATAAAVSAEAVKTVAEGFVEADGVAVGADHGPVGRGAWSSIFDRGVPCAEPSPTWTAGRLSATTSAAAAEAGGPQPLGLATVDAPWAAEGEAAKGPLAAGESRVKRPRSPTDELDRTGLLGSVGGPVAALSS